MSNGVSLKFAKDATAAWRAFYAQNVGVPVNDAFRGFWIPINDLKSITDMANSGGINGARIYLAKGTDTDPDLIHVFIVPTVPEVDGNDQPFDADIWEINGVSTIYDFTTPCPAQCDLTSPLY